VGLENLRRAARGSENLFPYVLEAFRRRATLGEVCGVLREEWGEYQPGR
jgi:methylmalonyl-CoA mutase N-terminal domain/subunit